MELQGKTIAFLGDSITEGSGVVDCENNRYDNRIKNTCGLKAVYNYGVGGTRLAHQRKPSMLPRYDLCFCGRAYDIDSSADIIVVFGGVNDYIHGDAPVGRMGDKTPETFYGAVWFLMNFLKTQYIGKTVVFMTPAHCYWGHTSDAFVSDALNKLPDALPLLGYVNIIKETGREFNIPVLDLFDNLCINPNNPSDKVKFTTDGLHFNDEGHAYLAETLTRFLKSL